MNTKKNKITKSPDVSKLKAVEIDQRTKIYIPIDADPEIARKRYLSKFKTLK